MRLLIGQTFYYLSAEQLCIFIIQICISISAMGEKLKIQYEAKMADYNIESIIDKHVNVWEGAEGNYRKTNVS